MESCRPTSHHEYFCHSTGEANGVGSPGTQQELVRGTRNSWSDRSWKLMLCIASVSVCIASLAIVTYCFAHMTSPKSTSKFAVGSKTVNLPDGMTPEDLPQELLRATATHGGANLAVATGRISEDADGIFFLDYLTGNLQCWVYYPRVQKFGAKFETNIQGQLPPSKTAEFLLVTGSTDTVASAANARPAACLCYVVDVKSGLFAAYTVPWMRAAETSGQMQMGSIIFVDGGQYRVPLAGGVKKPPVVAKENLRDAAKEKAAVKDREVKDNK